MLDLARQMLAVLCEQVTPGTEVVAVEQPFVVPLIDQETGEVLDRDLVGTLDLLERDAEGLVVVDLKTSARKYTDLQVEASLQLSVYSYAVGLSQFTNRDDVRLRFDVLTKTGQPELHRYWTTRDRAANARYVVSRADLPGRPGDDPDRGGLCSLAPGPGGREGDDRLVVDEGRRPRRRPSRVVGPRSVEGRGFGEALDNDGRVTSNAGSVCVPPLMVLVPTGRAS